MSAPWMKFYPSDWRADPRLRMCSLAARGLWMEMLALMHEAEPYGHLLVSGIPPTEAQLAVLAGAPSDQIPGLLGELETAGVFSRTRSGVIYSRRMTRDNKKASVARKNGKNGGNPTLRKEREIHPSVIPSDKGRDNTQKPDTRSQIPERQSGPGQEQPFDVPDRSADQDRFREFWAAYPKREGMVQAEAAFVAATIRVSADEIISRAKLYAKSREGENPRYTLAPAKWLTERRWTDEFAPPRPQADDPAAKKRASWRRMASQFDATQARGAA